MFARRAAVCEGQHAAFVLALEQLVAGPGVPDDDAAVESGSRQLAARPDCIPRPECRRSGRRRSASDRLPASRPARSRRCRRRRPPSIGVERGADDERGCPGQARDHASGRPVPHADFRVVRIVPVAFGEAGVAAGGGDGAPVAAERSHRERRAMIAQHGQLGAGRDIPQARRPVTADAQQPGAVRAERDAHHVVRSGPPAPACGSAAGTFAVDRAGERAARPPEQRLPQRGFRLHRRRHPRPPPARDGPRARDRGRGA